MAKGHLRKSAAKGLGRGLSALIPEADMEFLSRVARGDTTAAPVTPTQDEQSTPAESAIEPALKTKNAPSPVTTLQEPESLSPSETPQHGEDRNTSADTVNESAVQWLEISRIQPNPYQPRRSFSAQEMEELVASIREHGVLQPVLVRPLVGNDEGGTAGYQLIAGERRWRAAQLADLETVPAIIRHVADQQALELALIENVQRHDITALDAALAYRRLAQEFSLSHDAVARRVGKSRAAVTNTLRLLDLPAEAQQAIEDGTLSEGHGRAILLANGDGARRAVLRRLLREKLSVRATEELARRTLRAASDDKDAKTSSAQGREAGSANSRHLVELRALEEQLQKQLRTRVRIKPRTKGGQIVIEYFSADDLERVLGLLMRSA
jgi:ParB family chromosome partitioning protein